MRYLEGDLSLGVKFIVRLFKFENEMKVDFVVKRFDVGIYFVGCLKYILIYFVR